MFCSVFEKVILKGRREIYAQANLICSRVQNKNSDCFGVCTSKLIYRERVKQCCKLYLAVE